MGPLWGAKATPGKTSRPSAGPPAARYDDTSWPGGAIRAGAGPHLDSDRPPQHSPPQMPLHGGVHRLLTPVTSSAACPRHSQRHARRGFIRRIGSPSRPELSGAAIHLGTSQIVRVELDLRSPEGNPPLHRRKLRPTIRDFQQEDVRSHSDLYDRIITIAESDTSARDERAGIRSSLREGSNTGGASRPPCDAFRDCDLDIRATHFGGVRPRPATRREELWMSAHPEAFTEDHQARPRPRTDRPKTARPGASPRPPAGT